MARSVQPFNPNEPGDYDPQVPRGLPATDSQIVLIEELSEECDLYDGELLDAINEEYALRGSDSLARLNDLTVPQASWAIEWLKERKHDR